jgi:hypothetical protein
MKKTDNREDFNYVIVFSKIKVSDICNKLGIDKSNFRKGLVPEEKYKIVRKQIENKLAKLYLEDSDKYV